MIRLVVFDCDGTLVDSQHVIVDAMHAAFRAHGLAVPAPEAVRRIVGLSLVQAIGRLLPGASLDTCMALAETYQVAFAAQRRRPGFREPMFEGAREVLAELGRLGCLLGMATGKSTRGVRYVLEHHGLTETFVSVQTGDLHPSKPHPAMLEQVLAEAGAAPHEAVLVGDTTFDVEMARAAGVRPVGVAWGYHPADALQRAGADPVLARFPDLLDVVGRGAR